MTPVELAVEAAGWYLDNHEQVGLFEHAELEHLEGEAPHLWVIDADGGRLEIADRIVGPPVTELRTGVSQCLHEMCESGIRSLADRGSELTQHRPRRWLQVIWWQPRSPPTGST